jgi:hypothetical protein
MYVAFISNAMYFVGCILLVWLGFRMANNIYNSSENNMLAKVFTSLFCVLVAITLFYTQQVGGGIFNAYVNQLADMGASSADRLQPYLDNPLVIGGPVASLFTLVVVVFQLAIVWSKK